MQRLHADAKNGHFSYFFAISEKIVSFIMSKFITFKKAGQKDVEAKPKRCEDCTS
jgi:hypothetical protein